MKYNDNGEYKDIYVKSFDTLPVGTEVDFDGETVPQGWTAVNNVLWTNPNPTSDFSNQSVTLSEDANDYKYLEIYWKNRKDINEWTYTKMMTGTIGYGFMISASGTSFRAFSRQASNVTTTSIAFSVCNYMESLSSALTTANNYMIPYKIIGYKE